jgi:disulfide bond formation protein DsbB
MLCLYQRIPFFVVLVISLISLFLKGKLRLLLVALCGVILLIGSVVAFYHVGVEQGVFELSSGCEDTLAAPSTIEEMTAQILGKPHVPCDKPQFVFLGISMAGWNFLFSSAFGLISVIMALRLYKNLRLIDKSDAHQKNKREK